MSKKESRNVRRIVVDQMREHPQSVLSAHTEFKVQGNEKVPISEIGRLEVVVRDGEIMCESHYNIDKFYDANYRMGEFEWDFDSYFDLARSMGSGNMTRARECSQKLVTQKENIKINIEEEDIFSKAATNVELSFLDLFPFYQECASHEFDGIALLNPSKGTVVRCANSGKKKWDIYLTAPIGDYEYQEYRKILIGIVAEVGWEGIVIETKYKDLPDNIMFYASFHANKGLYKSEANIFGFEVNPGVAKIKGAHIDTLEKINEGYEITYARQSYKFSERYEFDPPYQRHLCDVVEEKLRTSSKYWNSPIGVYWDFCSSFIISDFFRKAKIVTSALFPLEVTTINLDKPRVDNGLWDGDKLVDTLGYGPPYARSRETWDKGYGDPGFNYMRTPYTTDIYCEMGYEFHVESMVKSEDVLTNREYYYYPIILVEKKNDGKYYHVDTGEYLGQVLVRLIPDPMGYIKRGHTRYKKVARPWDRDMTLIDLCKSYICDHNWMHIAGSNIRFPQTIEQGEYREVYSDLI